MNNFDCNYDFYDRTGERIYSKRSTYCFSSIRSRNIEDGYYTDVLIRTDYEGVRDNSFPHTEQQLKDYLLFLNNCGLYNEYIGRELDINQIKEYEEVVEEIETEYYKVRVHDDQMINSTHRLATLSAIRYTYENYYVDIPAIVSQLEKMVDWDCFEIFMTSCMLSEKHWGKMTGRKRVHGLIPNVARLQTRQEFQDNLKSVSDGSPQVNNTFTKEGVPDVSSKELKELFDEGKYEQLKDKLT